ncbi:MAG TPA: NADPH:quinone reductase [Pyrinomonadaceae bacterium]|jgi:NADPH2:quinone reductase|nr:NADPH:quinone reductase [Pyrinomonadaceae bacterium]
MRAIRVSEFGGPDVMRLEEVPDPLPGATQLVVRVGAAGVNPVETYVRSGAYARLPELPYTPGSDAAGKVEAVGAEVKRFKVGDRVYVAGSVTGTYAGLALCEQSHAHPLPDKITFAQGAALGVPYVTAHRALFGRANARAGETVLVHGASGGVGTAAVQLARAAGMTVIGTGGTEEGRTLVAREGAHHVLDHRAPDYLDELAGLTGGRGVDVIVEMLANVNLDRDLGVLARFGRVVVVGNRGRVEIDPRQAMGRDASVLGMTAFNISPAEHASIHAALGAGLEAGTLRPVVGKELPLAEAARAHREVLEPGAYGKIVLTP